MAGFDGVANIYDETRALPKEVMNLVLKSMKNALKNCKSILEAGVGTGRFAKPLQDLGFEVFGIDISKGMMSKAREKGIANLFFADIRKMPFRNEAFDSSVIIHVLQLFEEWEPIVSEVGRVSKKCVISLVGRTEGPMIRRIYAELRGKIGYPLNRFDEGEEGLRRIIPPARLEFVTHYNEDVELDDIITHYEKRGSSVTWSLPEEAHRKIMKEIRSMFKGRDYIKQKRIYEVAVWNPSQLRNL
jgi:SAM-dependent methyltransferase